LGVAVSAVPSVHAAPVMWLCIAVGAA
jgi:hypothetical protein